MPSLKKALMKLSKWSILEELIKVESNDKIEELLIRLRLLILNPEASVVKEAFSQREDADSRADYLIENYLCNPETIITPRLATIQLTQTDMLNVERAYFLVSSLHWQASSRNASKQLGAQTQVVWRKSSSFEDYG